jgi:chemotaxis protein methyltransferase CheR
MISDQGGGYAGLGDRTFKRLSAYIESELGIRMPDTKRVMLESRLQKRLRVLGMPHYDAYLDYVFGPDGATELVQMIDAVTTNKTDFFREPDHFETLTKRLIPNILERNPGRRHLSFWSAGCATGEEPYTLAMVLEDHRQAEPGFDYNIVATDISTRALEKAVNAVYEAERVSSVPMSVKRRYMLRSKDPGADQVRIKAILRDKIQFFRLNLMDERYPFDGLFDVIFCRNVIIYFDRKTQESLLGRMSGYLRQGGNLILGHSETLTGMALPLRGIAPTVYERL